MIFDEERDREFLEHYGVLGMHWGVRNDGPKGVSRSTSREAAKDAREHARAKMFYGEGAGTRRKLIKASVEAKRKRDPSYGKAFDHHLATQDMSKHASKARSERSHKDKSNKTKKTAGYLARRFTGEMGTQAAFTASVLAAGVYLNSPKGRKLQSTIVTKAKSINTERARKSGAAFISDYLKRNS